MRASDCFFLRVRPSFFPHGDVGWRPPDALPSPPPNGWSTGFIATPRTDGRLPFQRLRPAFPSEISSCSGLPTTPTVPLQVDGTVRVSPDGKRSVARVPSFAISWTLVPAERAILAPAEVDDPVPALRATALMPRRDPAVHVSPGLLPALGQQRLLRGRSRDLVERGHAGAAPARRGRLVLANGHGYAPPSKISIVSPWARVTTARFSSGRRPRVYPRRLILPRRFSVFTETTRTSQIVWIA